MGRRRDPSVAYNPVRVPLNCSTLYEFRHYCFPGLNLTTKEQNTVKSTEEIVKLYGGSRITTRKPLPCLARNQSAPLAVKVDPASKLVREKFIWKRRKTRMLDLAHRRLKTVNGKCQLNIEKLDEGTKAPYIISRLADHLSKNPDKSFKGRYNWYFDNALSTIQSSEQQYLLHAGGEKLNKLCISTIDSDVAFPSIPIVTPTFSIPLEEDGQIFHIFPSRTNDRIGVRQRNSCTVVVFEEEHDIDNNELKSFSVGYGKDPFVSADITKRKMCTVDTQRLIKLWNLSKQKCISEASLPQSDFFLSDKFVRVEFSEDCKSITAIDRKNIYSFDTRSKLDTPVSQWSCHSYTEACEEMSLMISSAKDGHYFVGTNHSCLLLDTRSGFVQKWTHMLQHTPSVGRAISIQLESGDSTELLILTSQGCGDVVAICNNTSSESSVTCSPFSLPTRIDTLQAARARGVLCQPVFQEKFKFSLIGLAFCDVSGHATLFSLVSTGDIFQQKLRETSKRTIKLSKRESSFLENWENDLINKFSRRKKPRLFASHTVGTEDLFSQLKDVEIPEWKTKSANIRRVRKFTKKELESYADFLAPSLISDYGVLDDSDWEEEDIVPNSSSKSLSKVQNWLRTNNNSCVAADDEGDLDELTDGAQNSDGDKSEYDVGETTVLYFDFSEDEL